MTDLEKRMEKKISKRKFLKILGKLGLVGAVLTLRLTACDDEEEEPTPKTEYSLTSIGVPEICESETRLEMDHGTPTVYCKDELEREIVCKPMYAEPTGKKSCYTLKKSIEGE
jgi:hypothetical protein